MKLTAISMALASVAYACVRLADCSAATAFTGPAEPPEQETTALSAERTDLLSSFF